MARSVSRKPVRILYLQPAPLFGGAERQAALTTLLLPRFGVEVFPLVGPGRIVADWLRECGVREIHETPNFPGGWRKQRGLARLTLPARYVDCGLHARAEIERLVEQHSIDLILASLPFAWITGSLVARRAGVPIVWRAGGTYLNVAQQASLWSLTRFLSPDLLLCNSEAVKATFSPLVPAPVEVVPNGVQLEVFHPRAGDASRYRPPGARWVVGCAMRLADSKRPRDVIAIAARLRESHPDVRFLVAGEGSQRAALEQHARESGAHNLSFLGFVSDMPSFYAACDLVVLPSRSEGCPNYLLEATAMGKPVVAAAIPPVVELLCATDNGVLFELGDVPGFARAVSELLSAPQRLLALGANGLRNIQQFSAVASAERIAAIATALVAAHATKPDQWPAPGLRPLPSRPRPEKAGAE
ncbi:MAG TPA: glycosyltransferase family 4 protein [Polyangiaceae bacterium]|nr:glycosyltransferase family 4 protein [Polyangiaceae bacterium]